MNLPRSLPNQITMARLVLAGFLFVILHGIGWAESWSPLGPPPPNLGDLGGSPTWRGLWSWIRDRERLLLNLGTAIFVIAAISDVVDGYIARRFHLTTDFGRIADPFADKMLVIGAFLFLVPIAASGVSAWMVVLIVARESLVDGIRGFSESRGVPFPALVWGKAKIVSQSVCITTILFMLANFREEAGWRTLAAVLLYWALFATLASGVVYVLHARNVLRKGASGQAVPARATPPEAAR
ncbi:CDP-diacylglycerol--glycerol-3-phosphate 3-phosphatidyltransferase [bacterium]|nr:CDP-diacylglycerol--glycerol-3-phosphate 3-phosphatidyltransferase [bacterium]